MRPIKRSLLVNTVTIYNRYRDPDTGTVAFFRTFLKYTRFMTSQAVVAADTTLGGAGMGATKTFALTLLVDPVSTVGYERDEPGRSVSKTYADERVWQAATDKSRLWTLQGQDYVVEGECPVIVPPQSEADLTALRHYKLQAIAPQFDKRARPGRADNIHHWECSLV